MLHKAAAHCSHKNIEPAAILKKSMGEGELSYGILASQPAILSSNACAFATQTGNPLRPIGKTGVSFPILLELNRAARNFISDIPREKFSVDGQNMVKSPVHGGVPIDLSLRELIFHITLPFVLHYSSMAYCVLLSANVGVGPRDYPFPPAA